MLYDSPESRKEEERFAEKLANARNINKEALEKAVNNLKNLVPVFNDLVKKENRTAEETDFVERFPDVIKTVLKHVEDTQTILDESLRRQSTAIYEHIKQKAESGDEEAIKAYNELRPLYQDVLMEKLSNN